MAGKQKGGIPTEEPMLETSTSAGTKPWQWSSLLAGRASTSGVLPVTAIVVG
jgi:hypothetical protein